MSLQKLEDRLTDLAEKEKRLTEKIGACDAQDTDLNAALIDALEEGVPIGDIDNKIKTNQINKTDCVAMRESLKQAIVEIKKQIRVEVTSLQKEEMDDLKKKATKAAAEVEKAFKGVPEALDSFGKAIASLYSMGTFDPIVDDLKFSPLLNILIDRTINAVENRLLATGERFVSAYKMPLPESKSVDEREVLKGRRYELIHNMIPNALQNLHNVENSGEMDKERKNKITDKQIKLDELRKELLETEKELAKKEVD